MNVIYQIEKFEQMLQHKIFYVDKTLFHDITNFFYQSTDEIG